MGTRRAIAVAALLAVAGHAAAQSTCRFIGSSGGLWSEPTNWDCGMVPANGGGSTYNVIIPASRGVHFDLLTPAEITGASFESGSSLSITDSSLEVLGVALLDNVFIGADEAAAGFYTNAPFAIACNLTLPAESDPTGTGGNAIVLFPGESVTLDSVVAGIISLQVKRITFDDDTDLDDPILELIKII